MQAADRLAQAARDVLDEFGTSSDGLQALYQTLAAWEAEKVKAALQALTDENKRLGLYEMGEKAQAAPTPELDRMTAHRAAFFIERFKKEEKLLGPNEQAALDFVLAMLAAAPQPEAAKQAEREPKTHL